MVVVHFTQARRGVLFQSFYSEVCWRCYVTRDGVSNSIKSLLNETTTAVKSVKKLRQKSKSQSRKKWIKRFCVVGGRDDLPKSKAYVASR